MYTVAMLLFLLLLKLVSTRISLAIMLLVFLVSIIYFLAMLLV